MANNTNINSAVTLDIRQVPGKDTRFPTTSSDSVFTFGNFRIERDILVDFLDNTGSTLSYTPFSTIANSNSNDLDVIKIITTKTNELNLPPEDPTSYAYFGSFYTKLANSINNIVDNYPYAILSSSVNSGITIYDYSDDKIQNFSNFRIPLSSITNQGNIIYSSGVTSQPEGEINLYNETNKFAIQLSGESQSTITGDTFFNPIHKILNYSYSSSTYLEFKIEGILLPEESSDEFIYPIYIRPSRQILGNYKKTISNLETQLLNDGTFLVPDSDTDTFERQTFKWPRDIDGFAPNSYGASFENYAQSILQAARSTDELKTDIMVRTMLPENYIDLDSESQAYRKVTTVYSEEFDKIKQYIDGLAYAHSVSYNGEESVPNKFIVRLANLLGAKLPNAFAGEDVLDYLAGEFDSTDKSYEEYNLDLWRRILVNIVWLYKKRGTRDAINFIFKLIGAPDCMFNLEEFVYDVTKVVDENGSRDKVAEDGYPDIDAVQFGLSGNIHFQAGGSGRGNGQEFINSFEPDYQPTIRIDNKKTYTGGTRNVLNSKELNADLRPSRAIECDVLDWYEMGYGWWKWGSVHVVFSGLTVPFEWQVEDIDTVVPNNLSALTIHQWLDYIYSSNVDPRNRKTKGHKEGHNGTYVNLKKIYITYMLWTNNQESNRLTFRKLEKFLKLLERNYQDLVPFFIPATSILKSYGTVYTNTEFNRHRFIYQPGINDGSEFKIEIPPVYEPVINVANFTVDLAKQYSPVINSSNLQVNVPILPPSEVKSSNFSSVVDESISPPLDGTSLNAIVNEEETITEPFTSPLFDGTIITFPEDF